jgi:hypothetical protein
MAATNYLAILSCLLGLNVFSVNLIELLIQHLKSKEQAERPKTPANAYCHDGSYMQVIDTIEVNLYYTRAVVLRYNGGAVMTRDSYIVPILATDFGARVGPLLFIRAWLLLLATK